MKKSRDELNEIVRKHKLWLDHDPEGEKINLYDADLKGADLMGVNLSHSKLINANLSGADLSGADLMGVNLSGADLSGADLEHVNYINVRYNEYTAFFALCCPEKGDFIGYKQASGYIVELLITGKRSSATTRRCRCSEAKVLSITSLDGSAANVTAVCSDYDENFIYKVGETVKVDDFDDNRWNECSTGIHFFITRDEAVNYCLY